MVRKYSHVKQLEQIVLKMKAEGKSYAEIATEINLDKGQISIPYKLYVLHQLSSCGL